MLLIMYFVFRGQLQAEREEKVFYRNNFFRTIGVAERQTAVAEELVEPVKKTNELQRRIEGLIAEVESLREKM